MVLWMWYNHSRPCRRRAGRAIEWGTGAATGPPVTSGGWGGAPDRQRRGQFFTRCKTAPASAEVHFIAPGHPLLAIPRRRSRRGRPPGDTGGAAINGGTLRPLTRPRRPPRSSARFTPPDGLHQATETTQTTQQRPQGPPLRRSGTQGRQTAVSRKVAAPAAPRPRHPALAGWGGAPAAVRAGPPPRP